MVFFLLLLPALAHAFPTRLTCDRVIDVGETIMSSAAIADNSRYTEKNLFFCRCLLFFPSPSKSPSP